jgi:hypothetical protein
LAHHRRLHVPVPILRCRVRRILPLVRSGAFLSPSPLGRHQEQHRPKTDGPAPRPGEPEFGYPQCHHKQHPSMRLSAPKPKRPRELRLRRGDTGDRGSRNRSLKPPGESFGSTQRSVMELPTATLGRAFCRPCLLHPLARLRVSGQWLLFVW